MKKKIKDFINNLIILIKEEYKFFLFCILLVLFMLYPIDYYITISGGIKNINKRVIIEDSYKEKGSFNISYVREIDGTVFTYLLSYIIPNWKREKASKYKIAEDESLKDIEFREKLDLDNSLNNAKYWGFTLAGEDIEIKNKKVFIIYKYKEFDNKLKVGDQIISIDNINVNDIDNFKEIINKYNYNDYVIIKVIRNNKEYNVKCKISNYKEKKMIGVALQSYSTYNTNRAIKFKFRNNERGSSGGLMTTLEIFNQLTKKDYTYGLKIAGTGTIESDGSIGQISGVDFKILGASKKGADIFFVPKDNYKECINTVKKNNLDIKVVKVERIDDAFNYLKKLGDD